MTWNVIQKKYFSFRDFLLIVINSFWRCTQARKSSAKSLFLTWRHILVFVCICGVVYVVWGCVAFQLILIGCICKWCFPKMTLTGQLVHASYKAWWEVTLRFMGPLVQKSKSFFGVGLCLVSRVPARRLLLIIFPPFAFYYPLCFPRFVCSISQLPMNFLTDSARLC